MSNDTLEFWTIVVLAVFCLGFGALMADSLRQQYMEKQAIQHGAAHYNQTNKVFEWNK